MDGCLFSSSPLRSIPCLPRMPASTTATANGGDEGSNDEGDDDAVTRLRVRVLGLTVNRHRVPGEPGQRRQRGVHRNVGNLQRRPPPLLFTPPLHIALLQAKKERRKQLPTRSCSAPSTATASRACSGPGRCVPSTAPARGSGAAAGNLVSSPGGRLSFVAVFFVASVCGEATGW